MMEHAVTLHELESGIFQITMQDRIYKNTFTSSLVAGLTGSFEAIQNNPRAKVVILTGYDNYFASGGTKEELLSLQAGKLKFTDIGIYTLALDCRVPVVAAMQGHGIGGGFILGLFADFVILSRESIYSTNFMKYGFTPGMGATYIVPQKLGVGLGHEMLFNAQSYRGEALRERGVPFPVYPRNQVLQQAYQTAKQLSEKPLFSLVTLKDHLVAPIRNRVPEVVRQELIMHENTFQQDVVKERIRSLFDN